MKETAASMRASQCSVPSLGGAVKQLRSVTLLSAHYPSRHYPTPAQATLDAIAIIPAGSHLSDGPTRDAPIIYHSLATRFYRPRKGDLCHCTYWMKGRRFSIPRAPRRRAWACAGTSSCVAGRCNHDRSARNVISHYCTIARAEYAVGDEDCDPKLPLIWAA